jgi:hypothetical protein
MLAHADEHTSAGARAVEHTPAEKNPDQDWSRVLQLRDLTEAHREAGVPLDTAWSDEMDESEGEHNPNRSLDDVVKDGDQCAVVLKHKGEISKIQTKRGESAQVTRPSSRSLVVRPSGTARAARLASTIAARTIHRENSKSKRSADLQDGAGALVVRGSSEKKRNEPEPQKSKPSKKRPEEVTISSSDDEDSDTLESLDDSSSSSESSSEDEEVKVRRVIQVLASIRKEKKKKKARKLRKKKAAKEKLDESDDSKEKDKKSRE